MPTINLSKYDELVAADGVYITRTRIGAECFDSVTNVGNRPTFGQESFAIESHLLKEWAWVAAGLAAIGVAFSRDGLPFYATASADSIGAP